MQYKKCYFCKQIKPIEEYYKNHCASDGHGGHCKQCEQSFRAKRKEREFAGEECNIVSFSGGKDSTAMLICLIEDKIKIDDIVWFDCGEYEFPQMKEHIAKVEKMFSVKVSRVKTDLPFSHYMYKYLHGDGRIGYGWPTPNLRWCTNFKINKIKQYLAQYRPYNQMIGYSADEMRRVEKGKRQLDSQKRKFFRNTYPLVEKGITEKRALEICKSYGFDWDGLYDVFDRVSCWCCPLQGIGDLAKLKNNYPEMYQKLIEMNEKSPNQFKNDPEVFNKVEEAARQGIVQLRLETA